LRSGCLFGGHLRCINIAQSNGTTVVSEEVVGLVRLRELDLGLTDLCNCARLPVFSPKKRMSRKNLKPHCLTYHGQVFARRRPRLPKVPVKTCNNDTSAVFPKQGRAD
jgi:hypothetical protein